MSEPARAGDCGFRHRRPFGAEMEADGQSRFRIWAPGQRSVRVRLRDGAREGIPMQAGADGWFELTAGVPSGGCYAFVLDDGFQVPDPASRMQDDDVNGWSVVVDPLAYRWRTPDWPGRPWEEAVLYELHVGTFTPGGQFRDVAAKLDRLADVGVTAVELMPVADFAGTRGWGYDGVLHFAPDRAYGHPDELKGLVDLAHERNLMVFLDVVYNHFGPEGNYLHRYAPGFFDQDRPTPWGAGIDFTRPEVRSFYIHNALHWLREYRFDGLRFDAVDWIKDQGGTGFLRELARSVRETIAADEPDRPVHLVLENDDNDAALLERDDRGHPIYFTAQWNDDWHHAAHVALTGESDGYYSDYAGDEERWLGRALATGYVYQGEASAFRGGKRRGRPSAHLPPTAFVNFLQNHDQIGNRAFGERLTTLADPRAVAAMATILLLAPQVPLLFMGEEWGEVRPFCYFCDFHDELADAVREGRRNEFRKFDRFASPEARDRIPDPNALSTFESSRIDWQRASSEGKERLLLVRRLLALRAERLVPLFSRIAGGAGTQGFAGDGLLRVQWATNSGEALSLTANLSDSSVEAALPMPEAVIFRLCAGDEDGNAGHCLHPFEVLWSLDSAGS